jgi:hypothetical protein
LPSAGPGALRKVKKNKKNILPSAGEALGKVTGNDGWSDGVNILPSAPIKSTRQSPFTDKYVAEWTLPGATLGKAFAECKRLFVECKNTRQSPSFQ